MIGHRGVRAHQGLLLVARRTVVKVPCPIILVPHRQPPVNHNAARVSPAGRARQTNRPAGRSRIIAAERKAADDGKRIVGNLRAYVGDPVDSKLLNVGYFTGGDPPAEHHVDQWIKLLGGKHRIAQLQQRGVVHLDDFGLVEQAIQSVEPGVPVVPDVVAYLTLGAGSQYGVQIVGHQGEPRVNHALVHRVVVAPAAGQAPFSVGKQRVHREETNPLIDIDHRRNVGEIRLRRSVVEDIEHVDQARIIVSRHVRLLGIRYVIIVGILSVVIEVSFRSPTVGVIVLVQIARIIVRPVVGGHLTVQGLQPIVPVVPVGRSEIGSIDQKLDGRGVDRGYIGVSEDRASDRLRMGLPRVDGQGLVALPATVVREVDSLVVGISAAAAVTAIAHASLVAHVRTDTVGADKRDVPLGVGILVVLLDIVQFNPLLGRQNRAKDRLVAGRPVFGEAVIHLVEAVGGLALARYRPGPGPGVGAGVGGLNVKLNDRPIQPRRYLGGEDSIIRFVIVVETIIVHDGCVKVRIAIVPVVQHDGQACSQFVLDLDRDGDRIGSRWYDRRMLQVADQRSDVSGENAVDRTGRTAWIRAGRPVLPAVVRHRGIDKFQCVSAPIMQTRPGVTLGGRIVFVRNPLANRPVALVGVRHLVDDRAQGVFQLDLLTGIAEVPRPTGAANIVRHRRVVRIENVRNGGHHQVLTGAKRHGREFKINTFRELPAQQVGGSIAPVIQFDELLAVILRLTSLHVRKGLVHYLADDHIGRQQQARLQRFENHTMITPIHMPPVHSNNSCEGKTRFSLRQPLIRTWNQKTSKGQEPLLRNLTSPPAQARQPCHPLTFSIAPFSKKSSIFPWNNPVILSEDLARIICREIAIMAP